MIVPRDAVHLARPIGGLGVLLLSGAALFLAAHTIGPDRIRDAVAEAGPWAPIVYILLKASTVVVTPLSGTPLRLTAGALFGFWDGVLLSVAGGVFGGSINFWVARLFGRAAVARLLGGSTLARVEPTLDRLANWRTLVAARVMLAPFWDVLCYGVGLTRLRFRTFLLVAALGDLVPTVILVAAGVGIAESGAPRP